MIVSSNPIEKHLKINCQKNATGSTVYTFSPLNMMRWKELSRSEAVPEVRKLIHKLAKVANVKRVRATAPRFPDLHWIDFELELQSETELSDEVWDNVQDLVIDSEWKLRDVSSEKWYFYVQTVNRLSLLQDKTEVIADSDDKQHADAGIRTWSSAPLKLVVH